MSEELKPCPFCGGIVGIENGPPELWYASCRNSDCLVDGKIMSSERDAINVWNQRAPAMASPPSASAERNAVLEEAALACDFQESWSKGESEDDQYPESTRKMFRTQQFQSETCAAAIRALKSAAPVAPGQAPQPDYRVYEFWSSASPGTKVRMLAEGSKIEEWAKRGDFIRDVTAPIPAPAQQPANQDGSIRPSAEPAGQQEITQPGWISVEDRMPPVGDEVLVAVPDGKYGQPIRFDTWDEQHEDPIGMGGPTIATGQMWNEHEFEEITHWMPLPPPPVEQYEASRCRAQGGITRCEHGVWKGDHCYQCADLAAPVGQDDRKPEELIWLYTHCRAIGMTCKSDSGKLEHDIALFTIYLKSEIDDLRLAAKSRQQSHTKGDGQ